MAKPLPERILIRYLQFLKWKLIKGSIDYNLYNEENNFLGSIKIEHGKGKKREVSASSVRKIERLCIERGLTWPPKKR